MVCPHCNGNGTVTAWRPSEIYEHGYHASPENGSWATRSCTRCEGTGHASDDNPWTTGIFCLLALILAIICRLAN
jgi:hypothetical protein